MLQMNAEQKRSALRIDLQLIADMVEPSKRSSALAFYALGIPIGTLLGMLIGGLLADSVGWRNAFLIVGLPGIALAVVVFTYLKDPRRTGMMQAGTQQSAEQMPMKAALKAMFSSRAFVLLVAAGSAGRTILIDRGRTRTRCRTRTD